ncbi:MAG TPA: peptidylprolyl isomerase, partial [Planctomycetota bacterium]|nr:peptidylprolyl isomerase [Planctomycetota bacterium]
SGNVRCTAKDYQDDMERYEAPFFAYYLEYGLAHLERFKKELRPVVLKIPQLKQEYGTWIEMIQTRIIHPDDRAIFLDIWKKALGNRKMKNELRKLVFQKYNVHPRIFRDRIKIITKFRKLVEQQVKSEDVKNFLEKEKFALSDGLVHIQHIFLNQHTGKNGNTPEQVKNKIQQIANKILPDFSNFGEIAAEYSDDIDSKYKKGSLGIVPRWTLAQLYSSFLTHIGWVPHPTSSTLQELIEASYHQSVNTLSQPIQSSYGFHLVYIKERTQAKDLSYNELQERARNMITMLKMDELLKKWIEDAKIEILF